MSRGRSASFRASLVLGIFAGASGAQAQGVGTSALPPPSSVVRTGDLREHYEQTVVRDPNNVSGPSWQITPILDVKELLTDNAYAGSNGKPTWDLYTILTPGLNIVADTSRLQVNFEYDPSINIYAKNSTLDQLGQSMNGLAHAILVPDTLFLDLRAFAGLQSLSGGVSSTSITEQNRQNAAQTYSFSVAPYIQHRFTTFGLAELGYTASYSNTNNVIGLGGDSTSTQLISPQLLQLQQQFTKNDNTNVVTQTEHASFNSGEDFGRVNLRAYGVANQYSGNGIYTNAHNNYATLDLGYAINRSIAAVGEVGYEDIAYSGVPPIVVKDIIWAAGTKLTLNADSSLLATYGKRFGSRNIFVDGSYAPTSRVHIYARYSEALTTNLDDVQNTLSQIDIDASGGVFDHSSGAPVSVVDDFLGLQSGVFRLNRGSLTAVLIYLRDSFSFVLSQETRKLISASPTSLIAASSHGAYGTLSWSHDLNPAVTTNVYVQYGRNGQSGIFGSDADSYSASGSVTYTLSETLKLTGLYSYQQNVPLFAGSPSTKNTLLVGFRKRF